MTEYLIDRHWLLIVGVEYSLVILVGIYATIHAIIRFRNRKEHKRRSIHEPFQRPHSASAVASRLLQSNVTEDNDSAATL